MKTKIKKVNSQVATTLDAMIAKIRNDVQAFAANMAGIMRDTERLAPQVLAAFDKFREDNSRATKLDFIKLLATKEQLAGWPETDQQAKTPGHPVQALFNSVEYLLRRANQVKKTEQLEQERERILAEAEVAAKLEVKRLGMKGEEADTYIAKAKEAAIAPVQSARMTQDQIAEVICSGWYSNLDDFEIFAGFCAKLLQLKYSENTVTGVLSKAEALIVKIQEQPNPAETAVVPSPAAPVVQPIQPIQRPTIPFRRHVAA